jgi:hypothetical protein
MSDPIDHVKTKIEDKQFTTDIVGQTFEGHELVRVYAAKKVFTDVSFKKTIISACYLRNCTFIRCDFTGAHLKETNFRGAKFSDCDFRYTTWEKSYLEGDFLKSCLPSEENLARDLVRSLRVNFTQIGNYDAVNEAAGIEVRLTGSHLYNAAYSRQSYYRTKYHGLERAKHALRHAGWKLLDLLWGNGESIFRVLLSSLLVILLASLWLYAKASGKTEFSDAARASALQFWGVTSLPSADTDIALALVVSRLVLFGLFMAILIKRLSRR